MFLGIKDKNIKVNYQDEYVKLPDEIQREIDSKWEDMIKENPYLWNGDTVSVYDVKIENNIIELFCQKSKYAHHLYQERLGLPKEYECISLSACSLMETKDGYFVLGELDKNTSNPVMINVPGGGIDKEDIDNNKIDCLKTIIRETKEEVNIDLNDKNLVKDYHLMGFYQAEEGITPGIQVFAKVELNFTKFEMQKHFADYYEWLLNNNGQLELKRIHFLNKNNCLEEFDKFNNPKKSYLRPLLEFNMA